MKMTSKLIILLACSLALVHQTALANNAMLKLIEMLSRNCIKQHRCAIAAQEDFLANVQLTKVLRHTTKGRYSIITAEEDLLKFLKSEKLTLKKVFQHPQSEEVVENYVNRWNSVSKEAADLAIGKRGNQSQVAASSQEWSAVLSQESSSGKAYLIHDALDIGFLRQAIETAAKNSGKLQISTKPFLTFPKLIKGKMPINLANLAEAFKKSPSGAKFIAENPSFANFSLAKNNHHSRDILAALFEQNPYLRGQVAHSLLTIMKNPNHNLSFNKNLVPILKKGNSVNMEFAGAALLLGLGLGLSPTLSIPEEQLLEQQ